MIEFVSVIGFIAFLFFLIASFVADKRREQINLRLAVVALGVFIYFDVWQGDLEVDAIADALRLVTEILRTLTEAP